MIPNNFSSIVDANFELFAALNQSITLFTKIKLTVEKTVLNQKSVLKTLYHSVF